MKADPATGRLFFILFLTGWLLADGGAFELLILVPTFRVEMHFVTLCVTRRLCDFSEISVRLEAPFRPSASDFEGSK
ncbi:hypothetical protein CXB40_08605 [Pseudomonas syringae pv. avii]|nr:hypothetical protein CXB40_08605 [Pseudomonas syringae pv. avii]